MGKMIPLTEEQKNLICDFYQKPNSLKRTAKHFCLSCKVIKRVLHHQCIPLHSTELKIELQKRVILTEKQEKELIAFYCFPHSARDTAKQFNIYRDKVSDILKKYNIPKHSKELTMKLNLEKGWETNLKKYGNEFAMRTTECKAKIYNTKKEHNTFNTSKQEDLFYEELKKLFTSDDIIRQYKDDIRYPFNCDFYIKSLDMFIELNLIWTHGFHPFNTKNESDVQQLLVWKERSSKSNFYKNAIYVWTIHDPLKIETAYKNKLNYILLYNKLQIDEFLNKLKLKAQ